MADGRCEIPKEWVVIWIVMDSIEEEKEKKCLPMLLSTSAPSAPRDLLSLAWMCLTIDQLYILLGFILTWSCFFLKRHWTVEKLKLFV